MERSKIILVTGDKGGVGKTFYARLKYEWLKKLGVEVFAFDTDRTNSTFFRFFPDEVEHLDVRSVAEMDPFIERAINHKALYLIDCGAGILEDLKKWVGGKRVVEELKKDNIDLKIEFVLGGDKDSVQILKDTAEFFGTSAEYVIVRNKGRAANFKILDGSKTKQTLLEGLDAKVIELKKLCEETASSMDAANCNFSEARDCIKLYTFARMRVDSYFRETIEMFDEKGLTWS